MPLLFRTVGTFVGMTVLRANCEEDCITSALLRKLAQARADVAWCRPDRYQNMSEHMIPWREFGSVQIVTLIIQHVSSPIASMLY